MNITQIRDTLNSIFIEKKKQADHFLVRRRNIEGRYVLYAPCHEPSLKDDWLADIRLYSYTFRADKSSIILNELGL
jgi:hypothetical protein